MYNSMLTLFYSTFKRSYKLSLLPCFEIKQTHSILSKSPLNNWNFQYNYMYKLL